MACPQLSWRHLANICHVNSVITGWQGGNVNMLRIDLNSDIGEGFGPYRCGDDEAMLSIVSSANVACGLHAGDPEIMARTFSEAARRGVAVGAHPGFPDLWGFGRRRIPFTVGEIERLVAYQTGAAQGLAHYAGHRITYVKVHGALSNIAETEAPVAEAIVRAVKAVDPSLMLLVIARSELVVAAERAGIRWAAEVFADRGYDDDGRLIARGLPGAFVTDPVEAADRALAMVDAGALITAGGLYLETPVSSVCVHGDTAHAVDMARCVRERLEAGGYVIAPFSV